MNPHQKDKKIQRRVLGCLARGVRWESQIARALDLPVSRVNSALDRMPRFLVGKHRSYRRTRPGARKPTGGGARSYSFDATRVSEAALRDLRARK